MAKLGICSLEAQFVAINLVATLAPTNSHMLRSTLYLLFFLLFASSTSAAPPEPVPEIFTKNNQEQEETSSNKISNPTSEGTAQASDEAAYQYEDRVYDPDIRTVMAHKTGFQLSPPIINLGNQETIDIRFDDHHPSARTFAYSVEHCTHDWMPSDLIESEYIDGYFDHYVNDYTNSFNTIHAYTHHQFSLPNRDLRLTRSGNYLLKVYLDSNPDKVIFTRRFMVQESLVTIPAEVIAPRNVAMRQEGQEIQFSISHGDFPINNPYRDLHVKLIQNQQWNTAITDLKPVYVKSNELVYDYDAPATFMAGNEYRPLDLKSFRYQMEYIRRSERTPHGQQIVLQPDEKRVFKQYSNIEDINGQFLIKNDDGYKDHTESDYAKVYFSLAMEQPLMGADIYVYGDFNSFECTDKNKMTYDADLGLYQSNLLFKQGYYNYQYAVVEHHQKDIPDITVLEGSFRDTENEYTILVYYRDFSNNYDQLIGVTYVYANKR